MRFLSRIFILPASFYYCRNIREWLDERRTNPHFYQSVMIDSLHIRRRLIKRKRLWQSLVCGGFLVARELEAGASARQALTTVWTHYRRFGAKAIRARVLDWSESTPAASLGMTANPRKILVADSNLPRADFSAGELATVGMLRSLVRLGYEVVFLPADFQDDVVYRQKLETLGVEVIVKGRGYESVTRYLVTEAHAFASIYLIRVNVAEQLLPVIEKAAPHARLIFHAPDLYFLREMREADLSQDPKMRIQANQTRDREFSVMGRVHHTVVVSSAEAAVLREALPSLSLSVFNVLYVDVTSRPYLPEERKGLFFIGGYAHSPNIDAVMWFVKKVWPSIHLRHPDATFHILGAKAPPSVVELGKVAGVRFVGHVGDLDEAFSSYRLGVAPLRFGAGIKGKVAATMGAGVPMVCTTVAVEGMGIVDGHHALVADGEQVFADAVSRLLDDSDLCRSISDRARPLVTRRFGDEANHTAFMGMLNDAQVLDLSLYLEWIKKEHLQEDARSLQRLSGFGQSEVVDVSIIVPVFNQWHLTEICLYALVKTLWNSEHRIEILLADDGSSDDTLRASEFFPSIKVIRNPANLGFLRNCNHAASLARGRYLLFLNNDTVVLPGWLDHLVETLAADSSVVIAGSKLLYPDGSLQEAGGSLLRDGSAINQGRGHARFATMFGLQREVDYISGASILVEQTFWKAVGGFDERYAPAYCEDSDLAMAARHLGRRVVYQPKSEVVHFEHASYAEQASHQPKTLQQVNRVKLHEKWAPQFEADHLASSVSAEVAYAHGERRPSRCAARLADKTELNVLYLSLWSLKPGPESHPGHSVVREMTASGLNVRIVLFSEERFDDALKAEIRMSWQPFDVVSVLRAERSLQGGETGFDASYSHALGAVVAKWCHREEIDIVYCDAVYLAKLLDYVPAHVLTVLETRGEGMGNSQADVLNAVSNGQPIEPRHLEETYLQSADVVDPSDIGVLIQHTKITSTHP